VSLTVHLLYSLGFISRAFEKMRQIPESERGIVSSLSLESPPLITAIIIIIEIVIIGHTHRPSSLSRTHTYIE